MFTEIKHKRDSIGSMVRCRRNLANEYNSSDRIIKKYIPIQYVDKSNGNTIDDPSRPHKTRVVREIGKDYIEYLYNIRFDIADEARCDYKDFSVNYILVQIKFKFPSNDNTVSAIIDNLLTVLHAHEIFNSYHLKPYIVGKVTHNVPDMKIWTYISIIIPEYDFEHRQHFNISATATDAQIQEVLRDTVYDTINAMYKSTVLYDILEKLYKNYLYERQIKQSALIRKNPIPIETANIIDYDL